MSASPPPAVYGALAVLALMAGLRWFEGAMLYFPSRTLTAHPGSYGFKYEDLSLKTEDGPVLHGWYVEGKPGAPALLVCHGNGGNISHRLEKLALFHEAGASVLLFDYRGYGRSTGRPTEAGTYRDGEAAYRWLVDVKKIPAGRIVFYGESLGNGVAVELALRHKPLGLIVDSAFTSVVDMGRIVLPWFPAAWLVKYRYDNLAKIANVGCPALFLHSRQDDIIPFELGRRLFEAAREPKTFFEMKGSHNDGFLETGPAYAAAIARFLDGLPQP